MILSGTTIGFVCVLALLLASLLLAILDRKEKGTGNVERSRFLSRLALGLFLIAFVGGAVVTLMSGIHPREESRGMMGRPMQNMEGGEGAGAMGGAMPMGDIGKVDQAELKRLQEKVEKNPQDVRSLERLGHLYLQLQDYENVFKVAHEALQKDPKSVESRAHMGMVLFSMQDIDQAMNQLDQALKVNPRHLESLLFKGIVQFMGQNNAQGAKESWDQYMKYSKPADEGREKVKKFLSMIP